MDPCYQKFVTGGGHVLRVSNLTPITFLVQSVYPSVCLCLSLYSSRLSDPSSVSYVWVKT